MRTSLVATRVYARVVVGDDAALVTTGGRVIRPTSSSVKASGHEILPSPLNDGFVLLAAIGVPCQFSILTWRTSKAT